jgi:glycosyltransferase involved in cell wall biosynthesis
MKLKTNILLEDGPIVFSANTSWYLYNFRATSIKAALETGHEVFCLAKKDKHSVALESMGAKFISLPIRKSGMNPVSELKLIFSLFLILKRLSPIVIFNFTVKNNLYGSIASKLLGFKCVNNISGLGTGIISNSVATIFIKTLYKMTKNFPMHTHVQNEDDFEFMMTNNLINKSRASVIPGSGVDLNYFHPKYISSNRKKSKNVIFIYIGRLLKDKGLIELYEAMNSLKNNFQHVHLNILGIVDPDNPSALSSTQILDFRNHPKITLINEVDDIRPYLTNSDCLILPSYREGLPRSVLEAMSMEIPVIASNVPGCSTLVKDGFNGFLFEARSSNSLCATMEKFISINAEERRQLGKNGREMIEKNYSVSIVVQSLIDIINNLKND